MQGLEVPHRTVVAERVSSDIGPYRNIENNVAYTPTRTTDGDKVLLIGATHSPRSTLAQASEPYSAHATIPSFVPYQAIPSLTSVASDISSDSHNHDWRLRSGSTRQLSRLLSARYTYSGNSAGTASGFGRDGITGMEAMPSFWIELESDGNFEDDELVAVPPPYSY